ncbi:MAG: 30S ribosomal protein S16 [Desulfomonilaceae bacterium]|nr:30S ribosomal protein S16 [Desulfomonilaceae bacterium]
MAVRIRLARHGTKKKPFYRVVAANSSFPRDGRFLDVLGTYDPRNKTRGLNLKMDKIRQWISQGAEVSDTVRRIMRQAEKGKAVNPSQATD